MKSVYASLGICLALSLFNSCGEKDEFNCTTNTKVVSFDLKRCFRGTASLSAGRDPAGNPSEELKLNFADPNGGGFDVYVTTLPYQPPFISTGSIQAGIDYTTTKNQAYIVINNNLKIVNGTVRFSSVDRTGRKASGSFAFTYTVNNTSGNFDTTITGDFSDVAF